MCTSAYTVMWRIYYLQVLLAVKHDALGLYFSVFNVHLVAAEDNGNVLAHTHQVAMPVGYVLVGDSWGDVEHDDGTLSCGGECIKFKMHKSMEPTGSTPGLLKRTACWGLITLNVVAISQASKLLLASCVPHVEPDGSSVGVENQRVDLYSQSG